MQPLQTLFRPQHLPQMETVSPTLLPLGFYFAPHITLEMLVPVIPVKRKASSAVRSKRQIIEAPLDKMALLKPTLHIEVLVKTPNLQQNVVQQASHPGTSSGILLTSKSYAWT